MCVHVYVCVCTVCACVCICVLYKYKEVGFVVVALWIVGGYKTSWLVVPFHKCDNKLPMFCHVGFVVLEIPHDRDYISSLDMSTNLAVLPADVCENIRVEFLQLVMVNTSDV